MKYRVPWRDREVMWDLLRVHLASSIVLSWIFQSFVTISNVWNWKLGQATKDENWGNIKLFIIPLPPVQPRQKSFFFPHSHSFLPPFNGHGPAAIKIWGQICSARNNKSYLTRSICLEVAAWTGHSGQIWFRPIEKRFQFWKGDRTEELGDNFGKMTKNGEIQPKG